MKHNFKIKIVALMATLSGTALGSCHAQVNARPTDVVGTGVVSPAEPTYDGAFGAVTSAKPLAAYGNTGSYPPIVRPENVSENESMVLPPIVTPDSQISGYGRPATQVLASQGYVASESEFNQDARSRNSNMLAPITPIVPIKKPADISNTEMPMAYAPAPMIQAYSTDVDDPENTTVQQAVQWGQQDRLAKGVSAAGVPLYPQAVPVGFIAPQDQLPPIVHGDIVSPTVNVPSIVKARVPAIVQGRSSRPTPPVISAKSQIINPMNSMIVPTQSPMSEPIMMDQGMMDQGMMNQGMMDSVMIEPGMIQDQTYFNSPPLEAPVISGCSACGGGGCSSCGVGGGAYGDAYGCQSCGPGGCFNEDQVADQFGCCGSVYSARRYLIVDALYLDRQDGTVAISNFGGLNNFDEGYGARITMGRRHDATSGNEASYFGSSELSQSATHTDAAGRINIALANTGGFAFTELSAFRNGVFQAQSKETEIHSLEYNKVKWGWDVVKTFVGLRYIYVEDDYRIASQNLLGETGLFEMTTRNNMLGPHVGGELFYDVGYRLSWSANSKFGAYVNPNKVDTKLFNAGAQFLDLEDTNTALSASIEFGFTGHYQLSQRARFRFGYTALWLGEVASVADNIPQTLSPTTGTDTSDSDDMFFSGISVGFEVYR